MRRRRAGDDGRISVLLLTNSIAMGGMEEHVRLLAEDLDRTRFAVSSIAPDDPAVTDLAERLEGASDAFLLASPDNRHGRRQQLRSCLAAWRFARARRIDVAHLHSTTCGGLWGAVIACRLAGVRKVYVTEHLAPYWEVTRANRLERRLFGMFVTGLVAVSEKNRAVRAASFHTPARSTSVVNNGIDQTRFDHIPQDEVDAVRARFGPDSAAVVIVGTAIRLEPDKGVLDLVRAFADVAAGHGEARLLLVGDGSQRAELDALVTSLGLADRVDFAGYQSDPRPFLAAMDVFVLPVPVGSASIGLLEAMATGTPAIISFGSEGEAVEPGISGWWAEPNDPQNLAKHISQLVEDPVARCEMGKAARVRIERDFSATRVAERLGALYAS